MKIGKFIINLLVKNSNKDSLERRNEFPPHGVYKEKINVPYIDDGNHQHTFDLYFAKENRKNCLVFDIHGGAYIFGDHVDNYWFATKFLEQGFDVVLVDYQPNDGTMDTKNLVDDIAANIQYVLTHLKELEIEDEYFALTGDSAGGHFALLMSELLCDKEYAKQLGYEFPEIKLVACAANCPVYDFVNIGEGSLTKSGFKRMFGPNYKDKEAFKLLCPKTHLDSLRCPTMTTTCSQDFLRNQSLLLKEDMKDKDVPFRFIDVITDEKHVGHVHNVLHPEHPLAKRVNQEMIDFISHYLNK